MEYQGPPSGDRIQMDAVDPGTMSAPMAEASGFIWPKYNGFRVTTVIIANESDRKDGRLWQGK